MGGGTVAERVGILGGTFDPVHVGHVVLGVETRHALSLDRVLFVAAGDPWQKQGQVVAGAEDRLAMVEAAVADVEGLEAADLEIRRPGPTYTVDTLEALAAPGRRLHLIVGADVAASVESWHRCERVRELCVLVVADRPGNRVPALPGWTVEVVDIPDLEVSSTDLRQRLAEGRPIDGLVPPAVVRVIRERHLYTRRR